MQDHVNRPNSKTVNLIKIISAEHLLVRIVFYEHVSMLMLAFSSTTSQSCCLVFLFIGCFYLLGPQVLIESKPPEKLKEDATEIQYLESKM